MKIKKFYLVIFGFILTFLAITAFTTVNDNGINKTNKDIIKFSHKTHSGSIECDECHTKVPTSTSLTDRLIPEKAICAGCHDVEDEKNCNTCHYEDINEPLIQKKSQLYFNHQLHKSGDKLVCLNCHKGINEVNYAFQAPDKNPSMKSCTVCHNEDSAAPSACQNCHMSTANLKPASHQIVNFNKNHKVMYNANPDDCKMCHNNDFCENCHVASTGFSNSNTSKDFYTPYSPNNNSTSINQQQITTVHDLNYRYTHGIDVKNKSSECTTCHQKETFCVECHSVGGGDFALGGVVPNSHTSKSFVFPGSYGTGGGEHSILAKRDIESCASCHDVLGGDPNCIMCHTDNDGIKMTNPRTHDQNFLKDIHGEWHNDQNAICYTCHTDANARPNGTPGMGFCGYCHGVQND